MYYGELNDAYRWRWSRRKKQSERPVTSLSQLAHVIHYKNVCHSVEGRTMSVCQSV